MEWSAYAFLSVATICVMSIIFCRIAGAKLDCNLGSIESEQEPGEICIGNYRQEGFALLPWKTKRPGRFLYYLEGKKPGWYFEVYILSSELKKPATPPLEANKRKLRGISPS